MSEAYQLYLGQQEQTEKAHKSHFKYSIDDYNISPVEIEQQLEDFYQQYQWPRFQADKNAQ